jgi:hypothetical protein
MEQILRSRLKRKEATLNVENIVLSEATYFVNHPVLFEMVVVEGSKKIVSIEY